MSYQFLKKQVYVNEQKIFYLEGGTASKSELILFLHGWGVGIQPYQEVLNVLCKHYQLIAPELPGFNKSSGTTLNWDYDKYAKFIIAFMQRLNIKKAHFIGHSLGGGIAANIAALMPDFVESLILVDSTGIPVKPLPLVFVHRAIEMTAQVPHIKFPQIFQMFQAYYYNFLLRSYNTIQTLLMSLKKDLKPILPKIESPCLLIWGANDFTTPISAAQEFSRLIKGSKLIVVPGVYHDWSILFVDKFTTLVFDFLDEITGRK
ncbi:alpha/beta hydrolase [Tolypothrix campylonemoides VB511288]|nr:alpha/beta hydrolase [Tolypothrix campylonemoides VB511288]